MCSRRPETHLRIFLAQNLAILFCICFIFYIFFIHFFKYFLRNFHKNRDPFVKVFLHQKWLNLQVFANFCEVGPSFAGFFFFSKFLMGDSKFSVPVGPRQGRSQMGGGTCKKKSD